MTRTDRRLRGLAIALAALAGFVDACGFLATGGYFVSFMSGNSTRFGIGLAQDAAKVALAGGLIATFLGGATLGALLGQAAGARRRPVVIAFVAVLLGGAAGLARAGVVESAILLMAVAMGVENNAFERGGEVSIGVTYMTGSLVKLGQRLAAALLGQDPLGWVPLLLLWLGFVAGVSGGALAFAQFGLASLWGAAGTAGGLAAIAWRLGPERPAPA